MKYFWALALLFISWQWAEPPFLLTDLKHSSEADFVESLYRAKKSIKISVFSLTDTKVIEALKSKAKEGLQVEVIADKNTQPALAARLGPRIKTTLLEGRGLMHHKITVIDDEIIWLGSANYTQESLRSHSNLMQKIVSKKVAKTVLDKLDLMSQSGIKKNISAQTINLGNQTLELWFLPDNSEGSLRIKELMRSAQKTIRVAMYTFTRHDFADTLIQASNRGVAVEVFLDKNMSEGASKKVKEMLLKGGIKVYTSNGLSLLHHKMMVIDNKILEHGSANFTKAAFTQNEDYFIVLYDLLPDQIKELDLLWQALKKRSTLAK